VARLFVAADLPDGARAALSAVRVPGRMLAPESLHVTLCFLGEVAESEIPALSTAIDSAVGSPGPIAAALGDVIWLPPGRPRVCGITVSSEQLECLQASLAGELSAGGWYEPEHRRFLAHVTLSRLGRGDRRTEVAPPRLEPFEVPAVTLYRSRPGSRYEALATTSRWNSPTVRRRR
jgi:2'-5' RNA ligase